MGQLKRTLFSWDMLYVQGHIDPGHRHPAIGGDLVLVPLSVQDPCGLGQQVFSHFLRGWGAHMGEELTEVGKTFFRTAPHSLVLYLSTWCPWAYELAVTLPSRLLPTLFRNDYKFLTNSTLDIKYFARINLYIFSYSLSSLGGEICI